MAFGCGRSVPGKCKTKSKSGLVDASTIPWTRAGDRLLVGDADLRRLAQSRREVGEGEEGRVNFIHELSIHLGFVVDTLPFRIVLKRLPVGGRRFAAGMLKNVDKGIALLRLIERRPISNAFDSVTLKEFYGVLPEACQQVAQFSRSRMIDTQFIDACRGLRRIGLVLLSSGPNGCRKQRRRRNRLEQCSSFHGRNFTRS
jgi:hypothetical protein